MCNEKDCLLMYFLIRHKIQQIRQKEKNKINKSRIEMYNKMLNQYKQYYKNYMMKYRRKQDENKRNICGSEKEQKVPNL